MRVFGATLAGALMLVAGQAGAVGFQTAMVPDPTDRPLAIGIWYPSDTPVPAQPDTPFRQALSLDAAVSGKDLPLVIISHGVGGWLGSHADTALALAEAGFVVVAMTHTGNNSDDDSYPATRWMVDRPRHISRVLDYMLGAWAEHARIDATRIGLFGFSAGAYTGLVAIGGTPNLATVAAYCAEHANEVGCLLLGGPGAPDAESLAGSTWTHDGRIKGAVLAAIGFGFAFDAGGLADVTIPVQLWAAADDRNVPAAPNTVAVQHVLPRPADFHMVEGAGHFVFLPPCNPALEAAQPRVWAMVCVDPPGFDRAAFHLQFNREVVDFFRKHLAAP